MSSSPKIALDVVRLPVLNDNYVWLVHDSVTGDTAVVDPAVSEPILEALRARGWTLTMILNTHHHGDHIGGNAAIKAATGCEIVGFAGDSHRIPNMDRQVREGDLVAFGRTRFEVIEVPGHTTGHIAYWSDEAKILFCGDTLFSLGCGRAFECDPEVLWTSLTRIRALPDDTAFYCAHEYTEANGRFAVTVDPGNPALKEQMSDVLRLRGQGEATVPGLLGREKRANPFLRADDPAVAQGVGLPGAPPGRVFAEVRERKNNFKG